MKKKDTSDFHIPRWNELPELDLYLDQVVTYIDKYLNPYINNDTETLDDENKEDKHITCVTKTMINNYVKQNIMEPPIKKKYNKKHIAYLFVICILKQVYSISDIDKLIKLTLKDFPIERSYDTFCNAIETSVKNTFEGKPYYEIKNSSPSTYLLQNVVQTVACKLYVESKIKS